MKLIPKAKPVRIRIKSGGVECKDLNDLRKSFNVDDLRKIEPKQLMKWLDQVDGGAVIAKKLEAKKSPSDLNYYQYFFNVSDGELFWVWKNLSKKKELNRSAEILRQKLLADGDTKALQEILKGKSGEEILDFVVNETNKDIVCHNDDYFIGIGKKLIGKTKDVDSIGFRIIERLDSLGVDGAAAIMKEYSAFNYKAVETFLSNLCEGKFEDYDSIYDAVNNQFGSKAKQLPANIISLINAVYTAVSLGSFSLAAKDIKNNHSTISLPLGEMMNMSNERLFLYAMFKRRIGNYSGKINEVLEFLYNTRHYEFSAPFMYGVGPKSCVNKLPSDIVTSAGRWVRHNGYDFTGLKDLTMPLPVFKNFLSLYFLHFLEPKYHNGDLSNI